MSNVLVLDLGTTYFKVTVFDPHGALLALQRTPAPRTRTDDPHSEIAPDAFTDAITNLVRALEGSRPGVLQTVAALTFATQTNSFLLLDNTDQPLTPIILWNDRRAVGLPGLDETLTAFAAHRDATGVPGLAPEFMVAKLQWIRVHTPEVMNRAARLCLISDFLTRWCTGRHVTEAGAAGLTGLLDIHHLQWIPEAIDRAQVDPAWVPEVARAGTDLGTLRPGVGEILGLPADCRFIVGCLDQYAGAVGAGNVSPGNISETTGTVLATVRCVTEPRAMGEGIFVGPTAQPGRYYHMCFGDVSAALLEAYHTALPEAPGFAALDQAAAEVAPGAEGLVLDRTLPTPDLHAQCREYARAHPKGTATRAILEAVAYALQDQVAALSAAAAPENIASVGGAARSACWRQIKADVLNCPVQAIDCPEPTSLGAALLAQATLSGVTLEALTQRCVRNGGRSLPDPAAHAAYRRLLTPE
jgi:xylulokinase